MFVFVNAIIYDDLNFTNAKKTAVSGPRQATSDIDVHLYFQDCVFMGAVSAEGKITNNANKVVAKTHTRFNGEVCFVNCDFRQAANFNESLFANNLVFTQTTFNGKATFNHLLVNGTKCLFNEITANDKFECIISTVRGELNFMDATFNSSANLSGCNVENLILNNAHFVKRLDLNESTVNGILQFNYGQCEAEANLSFSTFRGRVSINETVFDGSLAIERSNFLGMVKMNRSSFSKLNTQQAIFYQNPEMNDIKCNTDEPIMIEVKNSSTLEIYH